MILVYAGGRCLFDHELRRANPRKFAVLVAAFFQGLGVEENALCDDARDCAAQYILCLLSDMKDMLASWRSQHLQPILSILTQELPSIRLLLTLVGYICTDNAKHGNGHLKSPCSTGNEAP